MVVKLSTRASSNLQSTALKIKVVIFFALNYLRLNISIMKCFHSGKFTASDVFQLFLSVIFYQLFLQLYFLRVFFFIFILFQTLFSFYIYLRVMEIAVLFICLFVLLVYNSMWNHSGNSLFEANNQA